MDISNPRGIWLQYPLSEFSKKKPYLIITSMRRVRIATQTILSKVVQVTMLLM
ncbi:Uncharacterised protein [Prevotella intermedia]|nr:Uncharacterised protein [Prevotella intermedia]